jgi:excisionase family DNA binding protein
MGKTPHHVTGVLERLESKVTELQQAQDVWLTLPEAASYLKISHSTAYKWSAAKRIPGSFRPTGKRLYFSKRALDEFIRSKPITTSEELEREATNRVTLRRKAA